MDLSGFRDGLEVMVPQALTIRVPITGYPTPKPKWSFDDKELSSQDERVTMTTKQNYTELVITPSVRPDKGTYTLHLENDVTSVTGEIDVNVIGVLLVSLIQYVIFCFSSILPFCMVCMHFILSFLSTLQRLQVHPGTSRSLRSPDIMFTSHGRLQSMMEAALSLATRLRSVKCPERLGSR